MYRCMQQLNKKKSTRAVDAHTGTDFIQRGTTRGEDKESREKGRDTRGKEKAERFSDFDELKTDMLDSRASKFERHTRT